MKKTTFKISKMDCPSEENLIRMKLEGLGAIKSLDFDIPQRTLQVFHEGDSHEIAQALNKLNLGSQPVNTEDAGNVVFAKAQNQRKLLWAVLLINFAFFLIELTTGFISKSMGLVADSLDMLADALVYALSLFAVGGSLVRKQRIAKVAGYFQLLLAILGFSEVLRRFFGGTTIPDFTLMIYVSVFALVGNAACLYLLQKSKSKEAHMQASMIFTSNDIIINLGVIVAGALVHWLESGVPDLIIGAFVFILVVQGALRILKL
ncbi:cation transporter [Microscilla marina]|uniref:Co/Zn/Cd efflux system component n=1 Tax=Microscilla marina ATCC 23134 TaxID=313606 RepID=A1ZYV2_MICM2|nr:cation transporter [Microscilla marina]EAY24449.1 Co/Zn/Cd efflux system component [Microscilla marina ATCC 23134]